MQSSSDYSYIDEFRVIRTLGSGYHAKVKLVELNGVQYAVKRFKSDTADINTLKHELSIMSKLEHPNVARLIQVRENAVYKKKHDGKTYQCLAIILEYINGGELYQYVAKCGRFEPNVARTYFHMLIQGLQYIHSKGISHRDIKPQNLLLDKNFRLKITDFGFSTYLERGVLHTKLGTQGYMAPEIRSKNYNGQKVDLFAATVILFIMYSGSPPFQKAGSNDPYYKIFSNKNYPIFWGAHSKRKQPGFYTDSFKDFINKMLSPKPQERLTIEQIKNHEWYKGDILFLNDLQQEFKKRKQIIDKKLQEERLRNRNLNLTGGNGTRDAEENEFKKVYERIEFDEALIKETRNISSNSVIIPHDAKFIAAYLTHHFQNVKDNLIIDHIEDVTESFNIRIVQQKPNIEICVTYQGDQLQGTFKVELELGYNKQKNVVINFNKTAGSGIYCSKLINHLTNQLNTITVQV